MCLVLVIILVQEGLDFVLVLVGLVLVLIFVPEGVVLVLSLYLSPCPYRCF